MNPASRPSIAASDLESILARHAELLRKLSALPGIYTDSWSTEAAAVVCSSLEASWSSWIAVRDPDGERTSGMCIAFGAAVAPSSPAVLSHAELMVAMSSDALRTQLVAVTRALEGTPDSLDGVGQCTCGPDAAPAALAWSLLDRRGTDTPPMRLYLLAALRDGDEARATPFLLRTAARALAHRLVSMGTLDHDLPLVPITRREHQVLVKLVEGHSVHQAAEALGISPMTAHDFVKSLHRKLGVTSRAALVAKYFAR
jgi:DNA-binding CsgD family transcriptional regulator